MRGQIFTAIKDDIPPAERPPSQDWVFQHPWSLIKHSWNLKPHLRPSAVSLLGRTGYIPPSIAIECIVAFLATLEDDWDWDSKWKSRIQSLLALSLVSRSFYAGVIPFLYRDIRIFPTITAPRLSSLTNTLNDGILNSRTFDRKSPGYGVYTRTLLLCADEHFHILSTNIQHLLKKLMGLHTLAICTTDQLRWPVPVHTLSSVVFHGVTPLSILDHGMLGELLPFQRFYIDLFGGSDPLIPQARQVSSISRVRQVSLLPNLHDIDL